MSAPPAPRSLPHPYETATYAGLAGVAPVFANPDNGVDATDPDAAGGAVFSTAAADANGDGRIAAGDVAAWLLRR